MLDEFYEKTKHNTQAWWPFCGNPLRNEPIHAATYSPALRSEFVSWVRWGLNQDSETVRWRHLTIRCASDGEQAALHVLYDATWWPPRNQSPDEWLGRLVEWAQRAGESDTCENPPLPWDQHNGAMSRIRCTCTLGMLRVRARGDR